MIARPMEEAAHAASAAAAARVAADLKAHLHDAEVMAGYRPQPAIEVQNVTHGAGIPAVDHGKPLGAPHAV